VVLWRPAGYSERRSVGEGGLVKRLVIVSSLALFFSSIIPLDQAHAALDNNVCDKGELCVWENDRMTGCFNDFTLELGDMRDYFYDTCRQTNMDNSISSFFNNSNMAVVFAPDPNYKGKQYCAYPNSSSPRIHSDWYDTISSFAANPDHTFSEKDKCTVRKRNQG
jgi:hypothetical protein